MPDWAIIFSTPQNFPMWVLVSYGGGMLLGARLLESLGRYHFQRANRMAEAGFEYEPGLDRYRCPEGQHLHRLGIADTGAQAGGLRARHRMAIYRALPEHCNHCQLKKVCTPHEHGRHIYRSLAARTETDLCRFHQRLSVLLFVVGGMLCVAGLVHWWRSPGAGLLGAVAVMNVVCLLYEIRRIARTRHNLQALDRGESAG